MEHYLCKPEKEDHSGSIRTSKNLFWKKMKQILGEKDLFLISINYICEEKEKNRWKQAMYTPKVMIVFG